MVVEELHAQDIVWMKRAESDQRVCDLQRNPLLT